MAPVPQTGSISCIGAIERITALFRRDHGKLLRSLALGPVANEPCTLVTTMRRNLGILLFLAVSASRGFAQKPSFTVGWSVYAGWTPYYYLNKAGILKKWADKYGINIK